MIRKSQKKKQASKLFNLLLDIKKEKPDKPKIGPLEIISSLAGAVGIIGAIFWILGKFYYGGILDATHIPILQSSLRNEDYFEQGGIQFVWVAFDIFILFALYLVISFWKKQLDSLLLNLKNQILYYLIAFFISLGLLVFGFRFFSIEEIFKNDFLFLSPLNTLSFIFTLTGLEYLKDLYNKVITDEEKGHLESAHQLINMSKISLISYFCLIIIVLHLGTSYKIGYQIGCQDILNQSFSTKVYLDNQLSLETKQNNVSYTYEDYFLAFVDREYYYLYNNFSTITLKPEKYYIIHKDDVLRVEISDNVIDDQLRSSNKNLCEAKSKDILSSILPK